jgi:plastocyanin
MNLAFMPMHVLGLKGMPRRIADYQGGQGWEYWNLISTIGAFLIALSIPGQPVQDAEVGAEGRGRRPVGGQHAGVDDLFAAAGAQLRRATRDQQRAAELGPAHGPDGHAGGASTYLEGLTVFKPLQVFLFSLVPLALVFAGVIVGSMHGTDSDLEILPTLAPTPTLGNVPADATVIDLIAVGTKFNKSSLEAAADKPVSIRFNNQDPALHNFALYTNRQATTKVFVGDLLQGPATTVYNFTAPKAGSYYFRCDVHPEMNGSFIVK